MTLFNLGSINADYFYQVPHLVGAGETLIAQSMTRGLGGKGANMSVAIARAGAQVAHIGAVGPDGAWAVERLMEYGVDTRNIGISDAATAHAIISVDPNGENAIIIYPGANHDISADAMAKALAEANTNDMLVMQNETLMQPEAAKIARQLGLRVAYAAAPYETAAVEAVLPHVDILILNEVEMQQLVDATGKAADQLGVETVIVTTGARGGLAYRQETGWREEPFSAYQVTPVDTTGAGDTFTGYFLAGIDRGLDFWEAIDLASRAGAIMVTRHGTADVIPDLKDVRETQF